MDPQKSRKLYGRRSTPMNADLGIGLVLSSYFLDLPYRCYFFTATV